MMQHKQSAERVLQAAHQASGLLDQVLAEVRPNLSEAEFATLKRSIGRAMGGIFFEVIDPIWKAYPELVPPD